MVKLKITKYIYMQTCISEKGFIALTLTCVAVILLVTQSCTSRNMYGFKSSDFISKDAQNEILDMLDYIELEKYIKSLPPVEN